MTSIPLKGLIVAIGSRRPDIADSAWVAPNAGVLGAVTLESDVSIWYGSSIRGDAEPIRIGVGTNIQDNCVIHTDPGKPVSVGRNVSVGHGAILHGCTVEDGVLIGMGSVIMNGAIVGAGSLIAAGAVVTEGTVIPAGSLVAGVPGKVRRVLDEAAVAANGANAHHYVELAREHRAAIEDLR